MIATCDAGITAAAGTGLAHHLFSKVFTLGKSLLKSKHWGSPYHTFVHCKVFQPAAPRRARALVSVPFSGHELSFPLLIIALVSLYLTNKLISRRLILWPCVSRKLHSSMNPIFGIILSFPEVIPNHKLDYRRVTEHFAALRRGQTCMA